MRPDMGDLIIERPRYRHRDRASDKQYPSRRRYRDLEEAPTKEPMAGPGCTKSFSDRLEPLAKYLYRQVGRPWDAVWSEFCASVPAAGKMQLHAREHVWDIVESDCYVGVDGKVYAQPRFWRDAQRVDEMRGRMGGSRGVLYIHPWNGLLLEGRYREFCRQEEREAKLRRWDAVKAGKADYKLADGRKIQKVNGAWFWLTYQVERVEGPYTETFRAPTSEFGRTRYVLRDSTPYSGRIDAVRVTSMGEPYRHANGSVHADLDPSTRRYVTEYTYESWFKTVRFADAHAPRPGALVEITYRTRFDRTITGQRQMSKKDIRDYVPEFLRHS